MQAANMAAEELLPECFALVAEAIDRRLGVWRLFDSLSHSGGTDDGARIIAETMAGVARQSRYRRPGDILLPGQFYRAAREQYGGELRFRPTAEQLLAAIHLFRGRVVQMDAGEGKTVAIAFAVALHAVLGRRVHVITANDYLAERDAALLEPVYRSLGLSSGAVPGQMEEAERRHVYGRDIVYGAMRELGFDYLRDNLKSTPADRVQRSLDVAIVDEADHALIDEAFTPLIISGNLVGSTRTHVRVDAAVTEMIGRQREIASEMAGLLDARDAGSTGLQRQLATLLLADPQDAALLRWLADHPSMRRRALSLAEDEQASLTDELCYAIHPGRHAVTLTDRGLEFLEHRLGPVFGGTSSYDGEGRVPDGQQSRSLTAARREARRYGLANQVSQSLRAHLLLQRDVDYLVDDDSIVLVDPHTGRPKPDSIYQHGLQSAVEAREGVTVQPERETLAQISVSGFVGCYRKVAGITGTAETAAGEFRRKYGLEVAVVPPVHPSLRVTRPPVVYVTREEKLAAVVDEVAARHLTGQPVLLGTRTVEQSEELGHLLEGRGIPHRVLNAVTTHAEAGIVRDAGSLGVVTVATHLAGRGTDILLEPGLDAQIAQRCALEILQLLEDEPGGIGTVDVSCPSPEQLAILEATLSGTAALDVARSVDGCGLRIGRQGQAIERSGVATPDFALGLCVIGTEVHDSSRITLQLNGRSGRQGQFGLTQTFLSLEDRLVNLDAEAILKLDNCRHIDAAGRARFTGTEISRRIQLLQDAMDREGESQRALMQDYTAEFDRQTDLYHRRRQEVILNAVENPTSMRQFSREVAERVAFRISARHLGRDVDDDYPLRFERLQEELNRDYGVDCTDLYGTDLSLLPVEVAHLISQRLGLQAGSAGEGVFSELTRLLFLEVCADLWPGHIAALRDSVAVELLGNRNHKSAVASHIRRCSDELRRFWDMVDEEFVSLLCTLSVIATPESPPTPLTVSSETGRLLARNGLPPAR